MNLAELVRNYHRAERELCAALNGRRAVQAIGEWIARQRYDGTQQQEGWKGFDLTTATGYRIQAKARTADSPQWEHDNLEFDLSLCIWLMPNYASVKGAWELASEAVGRFHNGKKYCPRLSHLKRGGPGILDVTSEVRSIWNLED